MILEEFFKDSFVQGWPQKRYYIEIDQRLFFCVKTDLFLQ